MISWWVIVTDWEELDGHKISRGGGARGGRWSKKGPNSGGEFKEGGLRKGYWGETRRLFPLYSKKL